MIELKTPTGDAFIRPDVVVTILDQKGTTMMTEEGMASIKSIVVTDQGLQIPTYHTARDLYLKFFGHETTGTVVREE